jgi:hypothetical protein
MTLGGKMFYFTSNNTIGQLLEVLLTWMTKMLKVTLIEKEYGRNKGRKYGTKERNEGIKE